MLFVESKTLVHKVNDVERIGLLESLQQRDFVPLIRSARLHLFDHALLRPDRIQEMELAIAGEVESEKQQPYVRGDIFCFDDHVFFLIFDDTNNESPLVRAGIVYEDRTLEPFRKLDAFCRNVSELLPTQSNPVTREANGKEGLPQWEHGKPFVPRGFRSFVAKQDMDALYTSLRKETLGQRIRAASMLEDANTRDFLRCAKEAHAEGYAARLLTGETSGLGEFSVERLEQSGLVGREVQVSCRKTGHALFRLPNPHALAVVTVSEALCSECGASVADEKVEEVIAPTQLASSLLENGSWLVNRLHQVLRELGIRDTAIAIGPPDGSGHGEMMANICGEPFLLVARDGDLTPAFARRAIDLEIDTEASCLVIVATGRIHNHSRVILQEHARRRVLGGRDFELIFANDAAAASREISYACEKASHRVLNEQVCELDGNIGLSASRIIITKFMMHRAEVSSDHNLSVSRPSNLNDRPALALAAPAQGYGQDFIDTNGILHDHGAIDFASEALGVMNGEVSSDTRG